jgi:hypothetical protein
LTITRAQESSSARAIVAGDLIAATITSKSLTDIEADAALAFSTYKTIIAARGGAAGAGAVTGAYVVGPYNGQVPVAADFGPMAAVYLDPADFAAGSRTTKYRVQVLLATNTVSLGTMTFTFGLYPLTAVAGGAGAETGTFGTVQSGSTVAFANPATSLLTQGNSGDFTAPAAGYYALGFATSAAPAANSRINYSVQLQMRQV